MDIESRDNTFSSFSKLTLHCQHHPQEIANMIITNQQYQFRGIVCSNCLQSSSIDQQKIIHDIQPFKMAIFQIHHSCNTLITDIPTAAYVDHHINLIRGIAKTYFKEIQNVMQASITNYFQKTRELISGKYFQQFYIVISNILANHHKIQGVSGRSQQNKLIKRLFEFIDGFFKFVAEFQEYENLSLEERMSGKNILKQIKQQTGQVYKQFRQKAQTLKKNWQQDEILQIFNPSLQTSKCFRFSSTLLHHSLKLTDPKRIKMPDLPQNQHILLALIQPCIGNKKKSIKLKMQGIKGWVAAGVVIRSQAESQGFKFDQSNHGTIQISYDGYSWSPDSAINQQYTSWYFNENDILTITANPAANELIFIKNQEISNPYTLKYTKQKKQKLHFCVSVNYFQDSVSIVE